jgi:hypothetical protein
MGGGFCLGVRKVEKEMNFSENQRKVDYGGKFTKKWKKWLFYEIDADFNF